MCFKLKKNRNSHTLKYKARSVIQGFKQEEKIDVVETFAASVKLMSKRCLFKNYLKRRYKILQIDLITVILCKFLNKIIYDKQPHFLELNSEPLYNLWIALFRLKYTLQV